jgi:luciferase family oxidoreductase group 1
MAYFRTPRPGQAVRAVPGAGLDVPIWLLGSSLFSAGLAAQLGLPFAFAAHFAPDDLDEALALYRRDFRPAKLAAPWAMVAVGVIAADRDAEAACLFTSVQQQFVNLQRGTPGQLAPPVEPDAVEMTELERLRLEHVLREAIVGGPDTVARRLEVLLGRTRADEVMIVGQIHGHAARLRSFEIVAEIGQLTAKLKQT